MGTFTWEIPIFTTTICSENLEHRRNHQNPKQIVPKKKIARKLVITALKSTNQDVPEMEILRESLGEPWRTLENLGEPGRTWENLEECQIDSRGDLKNLKRKFWSNVGARHTN